MNSFRSIKKKASLSIVRKNLTGVCVGVFVLFTISTTTYAYYHQRGVSHTAASSPKSSSSEEKSAKNQEPASTKSEAHDSQTHDSPPSVLPTPTTTQQNEKTPTGLSAPQPSPTVPVTPRSLAFKAGRISSSYTSCVNGALNYTIGDVDIYANMQTAQSFTWRVELGDGTVSVSGTNTLPSGSVYWLNFPSTPTYLSMLATVMGASDGERARFVITSPNYSAGGWSDPVPAASEDACQNGLM